MYKRQTLAVFRRRVTLDDPATIVAAFTEQVVVHAGDDLPSAAYLACLLYTSRCV